VGNKVCEEYRTTHHRCAVCHWPDDRWGRRLEVHHLVGGPGRKHLPFNLVLLCSRCHTCVHQRVHGHPDVPKGCLLAAKREEDGRVYPKRLAALKHQAALLYDEEPIPEFYKQERLRKGGDPWP